MKLTVETRDVLINEIVSDLKVTNDVIQEHYSSKELISEMLELNNLLHRVLKSEVCDEKEGE